MIVAVLAVMVLAMIAGAAFVWRSGRELDRDIDSNPNFGWYHPHVDRLRKTPLQARLSYDTTTRTRSDDARRDAGTADAADVGESDRRGERRAARSAPSRGERAGTTGEDGSGGAAHQRTRELGRHVPAECVGPAGRVRAAARRDTAVNAELATAIADLAKSTRAREWRRQVPPDIAEAIDAVILAWRRSQR